MSSAQQVLRMPTQASVPWYVAVASELQQICSLQHGCR